MTSLNSPSSSAVIAVDREPDKSNKVTRSVLVIAPFGGSDRDKERRAILDVMRVKYLIEKKVKIRRKDNCLVEYSVDKHKTGAGLISPEGISKIASADILVALMTEVNVNVAFELAVRNMLRPEVILIVKDLAAVPVYAHDLARIAYDHADNKRTYSVLDGIVEEHGESLDWDNLEPTEELQRQLDSIDGHMTRELRGALTRLEENPPKNSIFEDDLIQDLDPGRVLASWDSDVPYAVFRIKWRRKASIQGYDDNDKEGDPVVVSGNDELRNFINWKPKLTPGALSLPQMVNRVGSFMSEEIKKAFMDDQLRLYEEVILGGGFGCAEAPIVFNDRHPKLRRKTYLPTLLARRTVGDQACAHSMYLVVAYVENAIQNGK